MAEHSPCVLEDDDVRWFKLIQVTTAMAKKVIDLCGSRQEQSWLSMMVHFHAVPLVPECAIMRTLKISEDSQAILHFERQIKHMLLFSYCNSSVAYII